MWKEFRSWSYITVILIDTCYWSSAYLLAQSLFNLIIFPKDRSIRYVGTGDTSQNRLCYISDKNNKPRRKEYLLRNILKSFVIGLTIIFFGSFNSRNVCAGVHLVDKRFMLEYKFVSCRIKGYENMFFKTWSTLKGLSQSGKPAGKWIKQRRLWNDSQMSS